MNRHWLREARERKGWTQIQAARHLGISQTYLSLLENGQRALSKPLTRKAQHHFDVPANALPVEASQRASRAPQQLATALAALGYPGFTHVKGGRRVNPAQLLLNALQTPDLEPRLAEALPWVAWHYADLNWSWLLAQAKLHDLQNRLGFVVALARQVAERHAQHDKASALASVEAQLERSRLVREDTLCRESMTQTERQWLRQERPTDALHWNLLTGLVAEHLSYAA